MIEVTVKPPDRLALSIGATTEVRERRVLEHLAVGEYRAGGLSHRQVGELLGLDYWQTERLLTDRKVPQNYSLDDLHAVDAKLIERYGLDLSRCSRARRRRQGAAGVQYLRCRRFFVLIATHGRHPFFEREPDFRDIRERPIHFAGYGIGCRPGHDGRLHASVRLVDGTIQCLRHRLDRAALHPDVEKVANAFRALRFAPYAPVCRQLLKLLWWVNGRRRTAGLELVPFAAINLRRRPVLPFAAIEQPTEPARVVHLTAHDTSRGIP